MLQNEDECAGMFRVYLEGTMSWCHDEGYYVGSVVDCLLGNTLESWKANSTYPVDETLFAHGFQTTPN